MASGFASWMKNSKNTGSYFFLPAVFLLCLALLVGTLFIGRDQTEKSLIRGMDTIRGPKYPKVTIEAFVTTIYSTFEVDNTIVDWISVFQPIAQPLMNLQPTLFSQRSPQSQPPMQHEPFPSPQLRPPMQHEPFPPPQLQPPMQHEPFRLPQLRPPLQHEPFPPPHLHPRPPLQYDPFPPPQLQPRPHLHRSPQNQLELQTRPQLQSEPYLQPQLQPQTPPQQSPQPSPQLQRQPQSPPQLQTKPQPPPQLQHQTQMQHETSPQQFPRHLPDRRRQPQPSPQLQHQTQMQQEMSPQLQLQPVDQIYLAQSRCRPPGSDALPEGLVSDTADLQMQPLWGPHKQINSSTGLFTAAVGIKQRDTVDKMVRKFLSRNFNVMLFHYDGIVDAWKDLDWEPSVVHVSAVNQTKWWFAKRFLHPDIVADYSHIFLWDEDLGVENFDPERYLSIVKEEGLEISQPALDVEKSDVHHAITARWANSTVHRRAKGSTHRACDLDDVYPPCTGWVEVMAPVFSRNAWRCMWYMIQKDLNHAWGLDILFGYCAQGDRTKNVGVVDAEYIVHYGFPTFGGEAHHTGNANPSEPDPRTEVRRHSFKEYKIFRRRWEIAAMEDESWADPYPGSLNISMI